MDKSCYYCTHSKVSTQGPVHKVRSLQDEPNFDVEEGDIFFVCEEDLAESLADGVVEVIS